MAKLISQIQNYPLSNGAVAMNNPLLLENSYVIQTNELKDYFNFLLEISKNINFFDNLGINSKSWFDLLKQGSIFRFAQFLTISTDELSHFFSELEQTNHFNSDSFLSQKEYETLCYQRLQIIQYLFSFYKSVSESITDSNETSILSILKSKTSTHLFVQFDQLSKEYFTLFKSVTNKVGVEDFNEIQFESINLENISILKPFFNPTNINTVPLLNIYSTKYEKIKVANKYSFSIFKGLMQIHQTFSNWAITRLNDLVTSKNDHTPHNALLITFCKLKMLFDQRYNQLITQDTSFVFEDILQLKREKAAPDTALISINLAKNITEYFIEKDSLFKAGKNTENKIVFYKSNQNLILNNAKIEKIKSTVRVFKDNQISNIFKVDDAANAAWQVNNAWLTFNDLAEAWTGIGFESKLISEISKKDTEIYFEFTFRNAIPITNEIKDKFEIKILLENDIEEVLNIKDIIIDGYILRFWAVVAKDLTKTVKMGINARICLISPGKENKNDDFVSLYKYLLSEQVRKVEVKLKKQQFAPGSVKTTTATGSGSESFIAFGPQSLAGSSFSITHPFLKFANQVDLSIEWASNIKNSFQVIINEDREATVVEGETNTPFLGITNSNIDLISFKLINDLKTEGRLSLPIVLQVKSIIITADLSETIYEKDQNIQIKIINYQSNKFLILKSISVPFIQKIKQKIKLRERFIEYQNNSKREQ
ncbi:MAG TPA: hypothetical protein VLZ83_03895 [Edaphocola sp.]|nr:hypothetical protein [Edaphocola sp.]